MGNMIFGQKTTRIFIILILVSVNLTGCGNSRDEAYWLQPENWKAAVYANHYCEGRVRMLPSTNPKFDKEDDCEIIKKVIGKIESNIAKDKIEKSNIAKLGGEWRSCAVSYYPHKDKEYCDLMSQEMQKKASLVITDINSWADSRLLEQFKICNSEKNNAMLMFDDERKSYCAAIYFYYDKFREKQDLNKILAWRKNIDSFLSLSTASYQSMIDTPCGSRKNQHANINYKRRVRVSNNTIYDWSECNAWARAESARGKY